MAESSIASALQVAFSFDTTGSMILFFDEVRKNREKFTDGLFAILPELEVAVIAHGDYDDDPYITRRLDFKSSDKKEDIKAFFSGVEETYGGDFAECYEFVLHEVNSRRVEKPSWGQSPMFEMLVFSNVIRQYCNLLFKATPFL